MKTNQVKNKPEPDTYFQNSITEEAGMFHLGRLTTWVEEFATGLGKGIHKYSYFNSRCLTWNSTWWIHLVNNGCLCPGKLFRKMLSQLRISLESHHKHRKDKSFLTEHTAKIINDIFPQTTLNLAIFIFVIFL